MMIDWQALEQRFAQLGDSLVSPDLDRAQREQLQREHTRLGELLDAHKSAEAVRARLVLSKQQAEQETDEELKALFVQEIEELTQALADQERVLEDLLFPPNELDARSAYIEIRAGAGGQEAALFAADLLRMYSNYALKKGWSFELVSEATTDLKGYREVVLFIKGKNVYGHLKFESGVHRVQRVPTTEGSGRIHTSTVTVAVFPEADDEADIHISPEDLRIDVYRASGAGGQHVNTTDSAVRITHIPTGVVVACQDERSQHKNKAKALKVLKSRLIAEQERKREEEMMQNRKEQVGRGMRAEKARTYNFPQNRVTDHQAEVTINNLSAIMEGDMDKLVAQLQDNERRERRSQPMVAQ